MQKIAPNSLRKMVYKKGEVWILSLPKKNGREQSGIRPAIVIADTNTNLIIIIPLTSILAAERFSYTLRINKSKLNNLERDSIALVFQMQAVDKIRFISRIGNLEQTYLDKVDLIIKEMLSLT